MMKASEDAVDFEGEKAALLNEWREWSDLQENYPLDAIASKGSDLKERKTALSGKLDQLLQSLVNDEEPGVSVDDKIAPPSLPAHQRAFLLFLRAALTDDIPKALQWLSRAVKLDPKLIDAWDLLGETYWAKGDVSAAENCFTSAIMQEKRPSSLRRLAVALRQRKNEAQRSKNVKLSLEKAREATAIDVADGRSWCNCLHSLSLTESSDPRLFIHAVLL